MKKLGPGIKVGLGAIVIAAVVLVSSAFNNGGYFEISKNIDIFTTLYKEVNTYYVDEVDPGKLMKTGIDAMLESLDPYTNYIPESKIEDFRFQTTGEYGGIGSKIQTKGDYVAISEPYEGSPADRAGLKIGDLILEIDGKSGEGMNTSQVSDILKGEAGTEVEVKIRRAITNEELVITITREKIQTECVPYYGMLDNQIGYIKLTSFTDKAGRDVKAAFEDLKANYELKGIILDLRGNPGGLLREAVDICNFFVEKGTPIVSTKGKLKDWDKTYKSLNTPLDLEIPVAVLVNGGSASASEIVSGTLQDLDRGVIVGQQTFGKGLVQQPLELSYGAQMKVTVAKYYTPSGRCIQAIDYSQRDEDGEAIKLADSLRTEYITPNGRKVKDGAGIEPDLEVERPAIPDVLRGLIIDDVIFDYAVKYALENDSIGDPVSFELTDSEYEQFVQFTLEQDFEFETETEEAIADLQASAAEDEYDEGLNSYIEGMLADIQKFKKNDIYTHKKIITKFLEEQIVLHYHYENGRVQKSLEVDAQVDRAVQVLSDPATYKNTLGIK